MFKRIRKAQSTLEFLALMIILLGAFLATQNYFKRGIQGRWKAAIDELGDQYDPLVTNSLIVHSLRQNTVTTIETIDDSGGFWTLRTDTTNAVESKTGSSRTFAY